MCINCNTITMHHASEGTCMCRECVWVSKWAAQLKTILVAKWEVPVSKPERLPKRVVTTILFQRVYLLLYYMYSDLSKLKISQQHGTRRYVLSVI